MKKLSVSALALVAALIAMPTLAHADTTPGWYVGGGAGGVFAQDPHVHSVTGAHSVRAEDVNLDAFGDVGYGFYNGVRLEGEYFHDQVNMNNLDSLPGAGGHVSNNAVFANVLYDFKGYTRYTPYVGVGVGPDFVNVKSVGATGVGYLKGDTTTLGYQGIAGIATQLDPNWAVTADYRYIGSTDAKVDSTAGGQGRIENQSHNILVGLRYSFGGSEPMPMAEPVHSAMPPMMAPHMAPKAAVAPVAQNFMVFFDFNKSVLTPEAKRIIASAAAEFKKGHYVSIDVTGHTDTVGTAAYNQKLSDRRAKAVKEELVKLGVGSSDIKEQGVGKNGLMVPTADGVREAQNRRAEIVLNK